MADLAKSKGILILSSLEKILMLLKHDLRGLDQWLSFVGNALAIRTIPDIICWFVDWRAL